MVFWYEKLYRVSSDVIYSQVFQSLSLIKLCDYTCRRNKYVIQIFFHDLNILLHNVFGYPTINILNKFDFSKINGVLNPLYKQQKKYVSATFWIKTKINKLVYLWTFLCFHHVFYIIQQRQYIKFILNLLLQSITVSSSLLVFFVINTEILIF